MRQVSITFAGAPVALLSVLLCSDFTLGKELEKAPGFSLKDIEKLQQDAVTLSGFEGKVVLLNVFTTTCEICRAEFPNLIAVSDQYSDREDIQVVGIAIDPMVEPVQSLVTGVGINYAVLMGELETLVRWKVKAFPTTFLINKEGEIYKQYLGYQPKSVFLTDIEEILD